MIEEQIDRIIFSMYPISIGLGVIIFILFKIYSAIKEQTKFLKEDDEIQGYN